MQQQTLARAFNDSDINLAPRADIYVGIHKALRAMMMDTLLAVSRVDVQDAQELDAVCTRVMALADVCTQHVQHENDFIHPAMNARRKNSSNRIAGEHVEHLAEIAALRDAVAELSEASSGPMQERAVLALYRKLALFIGENFIHMDAEESDHNQVLWACFSDQELMALEERITASIPPAETMTVMRWMIPAMAPTERAALLRGMQAAAPAHVVGAVLDSVQPHLDQPAWSKLVAPLA